MIRRQAYIVAFDLLDIICFLYVRENERMEKKKKYDDAIIKLGALPSVRYQYFVRVSSVCFLNIDTREKDKH